MYFDVNEVFISNPASIWPSSLVQGPWKILLITQKMRASIRNQVSFRSSLLRTVISTSNHPVGIPLSSQGTERFSSTSRRGDTKLDSCAKIAIPRLQNTTLPQAIRRVPRACHSCRQRKTKCSGDTPACRQCLELRVTCEYPLRKTDKMKE